MQSEQKGLVPSHSGRMKKCSPNPNTHANIEQHMDVIVTATLASIIHTNSHFGHVSIMPTKGSDGVTLLYRRR